jgi:flagellar FliL protein
MADEEKEIKNEAGSQEASKKGFPIKIILISIMVLLIAGGGLAAWKMGVLAKPGGNTARGEVVDDKAKKTNNDIGPILALDTFIVNLIGQGRSYLKTRIELELDNENTTVEINRRLPQLRDKILTTLSSKSFEDINTLEGKYQLRSELIASLNQYLTTGKVTNIYFTDFIVQ